MKKGFTLIELIIVLAILSVIFAFSYINATTAQTNNTFATNVSTTIADIKEQQIKAMTGDAEGRAAADNYGIHFTQTSYTLFHGSSANRLDPFVIELEDVVEFSNINVPNADVIFSQAGGEVVGFNASQNTVTLRNTTTGATEVLKFNKYGVLIP